MRIAGQDYGDIPAGATTDYKLVDMSFRYYAVVYLTADGHTVNGQTLNAGAKRLTHRIDVLDLAAGHLDIEIVRD